MADRIQASPYNLSSSEYGYNVKVNYWMPFVYGQGLHDASCNHPLAGTVIKPTEATAASICLRIRQHWSITPLTQVIRSLFTDRSKKASERSGAFFMLENENYHGSRIVNDKVFKSTLKKHKKYWKSLVETEITWYDDFGNRANTLLYCGERVFFSFIWVQIDKKTQISVSWDFIFYSCIVKKRQYMNENIYYKRQILD